MRPSALRIIGLTYPLSLLGILLMITLRGGAESRRRRGWNKPQIADLAAVPLLVALTLSSGALIGARTAVIRPAEPSTGFILLSLVSAAIEEVYFRSWLLSEYGGEYGPMSRGNWRAAAVSSLGFALLHHHQGWYAVIYAAAAGALYSIFFFHRRSTPALILSHWLHNSMAVIISSAYSAV